MHVKRRTLSNFERGSVALFASLALGGAAFHGRAQTVTPSTNPSSTATSAIPPNRWTNDQLAQAFKRTDVNADGRLSHQEAPLLPGLLRRFDHVDSNKDGSISSAEFDEALK